MWQANIFDFQSWAAIITECSNGNYSLSSDSITIAATNNDAYVQSSGYPYPDYRIPVTAGFKYRLTWSANNDSKGRIMVFANGQTSSGMMFTADNANTKELIFTVPSGTTYITMRVGVVSSGNSITYSNFKFQEEATWYINSSGELANSNFIELPDSSIPKTYPNALWRIDSSVDDGLPYNKLLLGVTAKGPGAFCYAEKLIKVSIPESVKKIGKEAFRHTALRKVRIAADCEYSDTSFPENCEITFYGSIGNYDISGEK